MMSFFFQVTVVVVFLVCHSVKLIINGYEVYEMVKSNVDISSVTDETEMPNDNNFVPPIRVSSEIVNETMIILGLEPTPIVDEVTSEPAEENVEQR